VHGPLNPKVAPEAARVEVGAVTRGCSTAGFHPTTAHELSFAVVSALTARLRDYLSALTEEVWTLERQVTAGHHGDAEEFLEELFQVRHGLLDGAHDGGAEPRGVRPDGALLRSGTAAAPVSDVEDQFRRIAQMGDAQREYLQGVIEFYQTRTNTKMTIAAERLAVIAAVTLPVTAVSSVMGMNVIVNDSTHIAGSRACWCSCPRCRWRCWSGRTARAGGDPLAGNSPPALPRPTGVARLRRSRGERGCPCPPVREAVDPHAGRALPPRTAVATVCLSGTLEDKLAAAAAAGLRRRRDLRARLRRLARRRRREVRALRRPGLTIDLYQPFRDFDSVDPQRLAANLRRAEHKFAVMEALGTDLILVCSSVSPDAVDDDGRIAEQLHTLAERAAGARRARVVRGARLGPAREHLRPVVGDRAPRRPPGAGLCVDSFHILSRGSDPAGIRDIPGEKLFFLQLADAPHLDMNVLQWSRHHRLFPGQGAFDLPAFLGHVLAAGYDGPLSLEGVQRRRSARPTRAGPRSTPCVRCSR
jgi:sugar phosphate isomerase/epimerase